MIKIAKLARPEYSGDWHDEPLRWLVVGPGAEMQKFSSRKDARQYARIRAVAKSFMDAINEFALGIK